MRTITETHLKRLIAQGEEANTIGMTKVAESLDKLFEDGLENVRADDATYIYESKEAHQDVNDAFWRAAIRISDYLGVSPNAEKIQAEIDKFATDFIKSMCVIANVKDGVGAYEPTLPGEHRSVLALEVEEEV